MLNVFSLMAFQIIMPDFFLLNMDVVYPYLKGKNLALLFEKPSTRTRSAFSVAAYDLGAYPEYFGQGDIHLGVKESTADTAKVLGRMYDIIHSA